MSDIIQMNRTPEGKSEMQVLNPEKLQAALARLQSIAASSENVNAAFKAKMEGLSGKKYSGGFADIAIGINESLQKALDGQANALALDLGIVTQAKVVEAKNNSNTPSAAPSPMQAQNTPTTQTAQNTPRNRLGVPVREDNPLNRTAYQIKQMDDSTR